MWDLSCTRGTCIRALTPTAYDSCAWSLIIEGKVPSFWASLYWCKARIKSLPALTFCLWYECYCIYKQKLSCIFGCDNSVFSSVGICMYIFSLHMLLLSGAVPCVLLGSCVCSLVALLALPSASSVHGNSKLPRVWAFLLLCEPFLRTVCFCVVCQLLSRWAVELPERQGGVSRLSTLHSNWRGLRARVSKATFRSWRLQRC